MRSSEGTNNFEYFSLLLLCVVVVDPKLLSSSLLLLYVRRWTSGINLFPLTALFFSHLPQ